MNLRGIKMNSNERRTNMKPRWLSVLVLAFLPWLTACANGSQPPKPPIMLPFEVHKAGYKVESEFRIVERQTYAFELQYFPIENDQVDRDRVWKLAGGHFIDEAGKWVEPGAPLRIKLKIIQIRDGSEQSLFEENIANPHLSSWSWDLDAKLANVLLDPGIYKVSVENLMYAPEFQGMKVSLRIARAYLGK